MSVMTSTAVQAVKMPPALPPDVVYRLDVEQYHEMIRLGILTEDDQVELLEGWLVCKMPKKPPHTLANDLTRDTLLAMLPVGWHVKTQDPITLPDSEPEPDVVVVRGDRRQYADHPPCAADIVLVVEVAETTLVRDRGLKKRLYARAGIPVYWILNLAAQRLEVYSAPVASDTTADYQERRDYELTEQIWLQLDDGEIGPIVVGELFA